MKISTIPGIYSKGEAVTTTEVELEGFIYSQNLKASSKDAVPAWSPCVFKPLSRKHDDAIEVSALVFDFDKATVEQLARTRNVLQRAGIEHLWHTSFSHTPEKPKWRLIVALDRAVKPDEWKRFWAQANRAFGVSEFADQSGETIGRFYYVPCGPNGAEITYYSGTKVPVDDLVRPQDNGPEDLEVLRAFLLKASNVGVRTKVNLALAGMPIAQVSDRDNTVSSFAWTLGRMVVPPNTSAEALLSLLGKGLALPGPETAEHWRLKFRNSYLKGLKEREDFHKSELDNKKLNTEWAKKLQTRQTLVGGITIVSNTYNAALILRHEGTYKFRHNELEECIEVSRYEEEYRRFKDTDASEINNWLQEKYQVNLGRVQVHEQADLIGSLHPFDPLSAYLKSLQWDGVQRCEGFFKSYFGVADEQAVKLYSKKWLVSLVARALRPGCKVDSVLVLQGEQGLGKSTALKLLTEPWFSDTRLNLNDKDALISASRFWVHEFAELASLKKASLETIKAFFTSQSDNYRPPHGRNVIVRPRRGVFVATTNEDKFLTDSTGNRRYWCVKVEQKINFKGIELDRDQLLAEAVAAFNAGEKWFFEGKEALALQSTMNEEMDDLELEPQFHMIQEWWTRLPHNKRPAQVSIMQVLREAYGLSDDKIDAGRAKGVGKLLASLKWGSFRQTIDGVKATWYRVPADWYEKPYRDTQGKVIELKEISNAG